MIYTQKTLDAEGHTHGRTDGHTHGHTDGHTDRRTDGGENIVFPKPSAGGDNNVTGTQRETALYKTALRSTPARRQICR